MLQHLPGHHVKRHHIQAAHGWLECELALLTERAQDSVKGVLIWLLERDAICFPARTDLRFRNEKADPLAAQLSTNLVIAHGTGCLESA